VIGHGEICDLIRRSGEDMNAIITLLHLRLSSTGAEQIKDAKRGRAITAQLGETWPTAAAETYVPANTRVSRRGSVIWVTRPMNAG
jgi:hypothetical protein